MKERPILFSAPMVRALRDGSKTQTRRALRRQPPEDTGNVFTGWYHPTVIDKRGDEQPGEETYGAWSADGEWALPCPYGQPGDRLWVRESWAYNPDLPGVASRACFMADPEHQHDGLKWKPSIHMPRAVCRINLEVVSVRVEHLLAISEADAIAEGIVAKADGKGFYDPATPHELQDRTGIHWATAKEAYHALWEQINGAGSWDLNPWVWAIEFRRIP